MPVYRRERGKWTLDHPAEEDSQATESYHNVGGQRAYVRDSRTAFPVPLEKKAANNARLKKMRHEADSDDNSWAFWKGAEPVSTGDANHPNASGSSSSSDLQAHAKLATGSWHEFQWPSTDVSAAAAVMPAAAATTPKAHWRVKSEHGASGSQPWVKKPEQEASGSQPDQTRAPRAQPPGQAQQLLATHNRDGLSRSDPCRSPSPPRAPKAVAKPAVSHAGKGLPRGGKASAARPWLVGQPASRFTGARVRQAKVQGPKGSGVAGRIQLGPQPKLGPKPNALHSKSSISLRRAGESVEKKKYTSIVSGLAKPTEKTDKYEACPPKPGEVPQFHERANGTPSLWNKGKPLYWSKHVKNRSCFAQNINSSLEESLNRVMEFLRVRSGPDNHPILRNLQELSEDTGLHGWYEFRWAPFEDAGGISSLPTESLGLHGWQGASDWQSAWHACKFEALYSIMYHGHLFASCDKEKGHRFLGEGKKERPGVYVHKEATCHKTSNYFRFVPLFNDGVFWTALWEVMVDRSDRVPGNHPDQWVQQERSVKLKALWLAGCTYEDMPPNWEVSEFWDPLLEAHPMAT